MTKTKELEEIVARELCEFDAINWDMIAEKRIGLYASVDRRHYYRNARKLLKLIAERCVFLAEEELPENPYPISVGSWGRHVWDNAMEAVRDAGFRATEPIEMKQVE